MGEAAQFISENESKAGENQRALRFWQIIAESEPIMDDINVKILKQYFENWFEEYESSGRPENMRLDAYNVLESMQSGAKKDREKDVYCALWEIVEPLETSDKLELV